MKQDLQKELIRDLVAESNEALDQFDQELLALEKGESSADTLNNIFRVIHSLKGTSGCLGLNQLESLAHAGENLLSLLRDGAFIANSQMVSTLLSCSDGLRRMLRHLDTEGDEGTHDNSGLIRDLRLLSEVSVVRTAEENQAFGLFDDDLSPASGSFAPEEIPVSLAVAEPVTPAPSTGAAVRNSASTPSSENAIRVDLEHLDGMIDLVGELVIARNQIVQFTGGLDEPSLVNATQRLNIITSKLQETVMKTRMQPIGNVWSKFPRIVRDVSRDLGKHVRLELEGKDTDLDRNIIEAIKDPLTHLVRNAIDHGLETPAHRIAAGKSPEGLLRLRAFHEGGQVNIEIYDDGAGIHREKVLRRAIQRGLIQAANATALSEQEVFSLLFAPGFSTAEKVTNLSGRGVGLDVVKNNIERIGGAVHVQSEVGRSTTFRIRIPLTLAIIPALIIRCGARRYAIPQLSLVELVRIDAEQSARAIEYVSGSPVYRRRGNLLPVLYLREQLGISSETAADNGSIYLLILQAETRQFGLVVEKIGDTEEIVVKPLGSELKGLSVYAGATIMGDGCVALILDVLGLARRASILGESSRLQHDVSTEVEHEKSSAKRQSLIIFALGDGRQAAISLSQVERLEEFDPKSIELSGESQVIQYRGEIMPLVRVNSLLGATEQVVHSEDRVRVIVYNHLGRRIGLIVDRILDTVHEEVDIQKTTNRPCILGSGIVLKRVTDFIDMMAVLQNSGVVCFGEREQ